MDCKKNSCSHIDNVNYVNCLICREQSICLHINILSDVHNGCLVCTDCGRVQSNQLYFEEYGYSNEIKNNSSEVKQNIDEIISRLHLPDKYSEIILDEVLKNNLNLSDKNINNVLYDNLNKNDISISIKEINKVSEKRKIKKEKNKSNVVIFKIENCLEKYCTIFNLTYKEYTVIKENIFCIPLTGHNPLTIIGTFIYKFAKENKKKISMKKISEVLNINPISIQRYLKNELSCRS